jgi:regulator of protease activity HflC (stomatin/prohibitin superfamily)
MIAFPWSRQDASGNPSLLRRTLRFFWRHIVNLTLFLLIALFVVVVLGPYMVVNVPSGSVGVLWKRFGGGTMLDPRYLKGEGLNIILPWDRVFIYNLRIQSKSETYNAISSDGVNLTATVNIRFRLRRELIAYLHQAIGPDYMSLLGFEVASRMREVVSQYTAEQVYSTERQKIQDEIKNRVIERLGERFLEGAGGYRVPIREAGVLYDTLLHEIRLPAEVVTAINRKAEQYYVAQEFVYRVERERRESERKKIEAEGIRDFQQTVVQGISDSYLRWRGIEATLELSRSNNAKIVIVGGGRDGLPIILGNVDTPPAPPGAATPGGATPGSATPGATPGGTTPGGAATGAQPGSAPSGSGTAAPDGQGPAGAPSGTPDRRSLLPFGYSSVENFLSRFWDRSTNAWDQGAATGKRPEVAVTPAPRP